MPLDVFPGEIVVPSRDQARDDYCRDHRFHAPNIATDKNTQPWVDASTHADAMVPAWALCIKAGQRLDLDKIAGTDLEQESINAGLPGRLPPAGSIGFVACKASLGGTTILAGATLTQLGTSYKFQCLLTAVYQDGDAVPIQGVTTGPQTNLLAGASLQWDLPPIGCGPLATVTAPGLSNGRDREDDPGIRVRIRDARANPAASGNEAQYRRIIESTPGVPVEQAWTYAAIKGPGSIGFVFTIRPSKIGSSRIPNAAQIAVVRANLVGLMPGTDSIFACAIVSSALDLYLHAAWASRAATWSDVAPWPLFADVPAAASSATSPTAFVIGYTGTTVDGAQVAPQVGQQIAFLDLSAPDGPTFRKKTLLTVALAGGFATVTCDTTNGASDATYTPLVGQPCCPWSDSLTKIIPDVIDRLNLLGPGEQIAPGLLFDDGLRQRRDPRTPDQWPSDLTHRVLTELFAEPALGDVSVLGPALPAACPTGSAGVSSNLLTLRYLTAFPR